MKQEEYVLTQEEVQSTVLLIVLMIVGCALFLDFVAGVGLGALMLWRFLSSHLKTEQSELSIDAIEAKAAGSFLLLLIQSESCLLTLHPSPMKTGLDTRYFRLVPIKDYKINKLKIGDNETSLLRFKKTIQPGQLVVVWPTTITPEKVPRAGQQFLAANLTRSEFHSLSPVFGCDTHEGLSYAICTIQ